MSSQTSSIECSNKTLQPFKTKRKIGENFSVYQVTMAPADYSLYTNEHFIQNTIPASDIYTILEVSWSNFASLLYQKQLMGIQKNNF